jgi:hypothetical protein
MRDFIVTLFARFDLQHTDAVADDKAIYIEHGGKILKLTVTEGTRAEWDAAWDYNDKLNGVSE